MRPVSHPTSPDEGLGDLALPAPRTEHLASALGIPTPEFIGIFGLGWTELDSSRPTDERGHLDTLTAWCISGTPAQLMMRVTRDGAELAIPKGHWSSHQLELVAASNVLVPTIEIFDSSTTLLVAELLKKRRSTFRYCRYCRTLTPPEGRASSDSCFGCESQVHHVIY